MVACLLSTKQDLANPAADLADVDQGAKRLVSFISKRITKGTLKPLWPQGVFCIDEVISKIAHIDGFWKLSLKKEE